MKLTEQVHKLEKDMFQLMIDTSKAMLFMDQRSVRTSLATMKLLNEKYKEITKQDYVKPAYLDKQYARLQNGCL